MAPEANSSGWPLIGRIFSLMLGPAFLFILAVSIARSGGGWLTRKDFAFLVLLAAVIAGRLVEFSGKDPRTASGEPATAHDLRLFIGLTLLLGSATWVLANLVGNHWPH